jgi:ketosteroid isomerase-like protein
VIIMKYRITPALALIFFVTVFGQRAGMSDELRAVVETERAFARTASEKGMKHAFLAFAADNGLLFRQAVVNAKETWNNTNPAPTGLLLWGPAFADIAKSGELAYDFGGWEFRPKRTDKDAVGHGTFVTVWRKQPDGQWKFELDIGVSHPVPAAGTSQVVEYPLDPSLTGRGSDEKDHSDTARQELLDAEAAMSVSAGSKGSANALLSRADEKIHMFRPEIAPLKGKKAVRELLTAKASLVQWRADKAAAARSGELGYVYGTFESKKNAKDEKPPEQGHFVRIWKRQSDGEWRIVLDIINPIVPPTK